jgi:hypothetical protein
MGLRIYAADNDVKSVQIGRACLYGYPMPFGLQIDNNKKIDSVQIGQLITDQTGVGASSASIILIALTGQVHRFHIDDAVVRGGGTGMLVSTPSNASFVGQITVGRLEVFNSSDVAVMADNGASIDIGQLVASSCFTGVFRLIPGCKIRVGSLSQINTATLYTTTSGGAAPTLSNAWTQWAANDPFSVDLQGGRASLRGLIMPGTSNVFTTLPAWARPASNKRFMAQGKAGTTVVSVPVFVGADGSCSVNEIAGGTANCADWLSLSGISWDLQA